MRDIENVIDDIVKSSNQDLIQENANTDGRSPIGQISLTASEAMKEYSKKFLKQDVLEHFEKGYIHIHDFDFYATGTTTCTQIPLGKVLSEGFKVGNCPMRPPTTISSALALTAILIQSNQNMQHGGQAYPNFDYDLAPYVEMSYNKLVNKYANLGLESFESLVMDELNKEVYQAMEGFVHNCNSMQSRNGMQVPFTSVNFGLDTSKWGRMVSENLLKAQRAGLGDGSTPIFPILIFKVKKGINFEKGEPNHDLYELGLDCLSKRLFPNFQFVDTPFNIKGFDINNKDTHIATMGCRTRIFEDVTQGKNHIEGRGNLSFTSLNLPMLARRATQHPNYKSLKSEFLDVVEEFSRTVCDQLFDRYQYQYNVSKDNFKLLYNNTWLTEDILNKKVGDRLNVGSMALGYIGLAEALILITGKHHGEDSEAQKLGLEVVSLMKRVTDEYTEKYKLNFSVIATPAEGLSGTALRKFKKEYGHVPRVTDYEFFTNSNHVPVWYNISAKKKIEIEAPYHALTLGGHITYIEVDGDTQNNLEALDDIVKTMAKAGVGYGSINVPLDRCSDCNLQQVIYDKCPICGSTNISRIRRITGYLVGDMDKWNTAKKDEEKNRVKHGKE